MEKSGTRENVKLFQDAFARVFENQIKQLIHDSRQEALAQAREMMQEVAYDDSPGKAARVFSETGTSSSGSSADMTGLRAAPEPVKGSDEAPPLVDDNFLNEIEAVREQIRRNELLLNQIKPFIQSTKVQKD